ncbi:hypothetical protein A3K48_07315 [candidate division WOR-1 bacterium RIFOXYA12_FULL_52_29]|uniref:Site-specific DNA-methyltransferase (adenine-specific) n=1 Tax=candidate division WOR-1 bacterium RIFOXYC12_FULL_54_18 TaxID=1802584 RepID=A0A1F4T9K7_UNCSA|nr:MAG: hypothetical protein A3K44_07315 [candidate division WOR-1 bacterium RIFOXYA2_FULL_51_19]OGC18326.1 MAG: hypothetical protein A3K48_07315 [candidate division WOR-1 bacterium RIFOXYA12_FULL_52_29]OGC27181.1 MAG: hypothetical protein A3K32_07310 [candidate division WOR-1 bacterium RIFOXYB2_FULL_45_9]OGC28743.1 MAG: hypothetical protein A3K49_07315 [candidate division WOR-1 bacterium RIFOXYC12_FULL_54_18]OGC30802.1 MAG: hypothetical protein A2346_05305 [candidate division WOR-1 bacterium R
MKSKNKKPIIKQKPFLKWAGGKSQLLSTIINHLPQKYNRYIEPFVGGGALLFALEPRKAIISDLNEELINCYKTVKNNVDSLIEDLHKHENDKHYFYQIRSQSIKILSEIERASRFIYLNKTCFNGLWRVNKQNQFNTPFGGYKNPKIVNVSALKQASRYLQHVKIFYGDYYKILQKYARKDDFVYLDPPYYPISKYSDFKRYTKEGFDIIQQKRLAHLFKILDARGCKLLLSNSSAECIANLYSEYTVITVRAKRLINSDHNKRGFVKEILVNNYERTH